MILSRRIKFNGVQLDELDESIVIRSIDHGVPKDNTQAADKMGGWGQRVTGQHWSTVEAAVTFAIDIPKTEMNRRRNVFDQVIAWAANRTGWLEFNTIDDRHLWVEKAVIPGGGDMWNWTSDYTIIFRAYAVPFWESITPTTVAVNSVSSYGIPIDIGGTAPGVLDVSFRNVSGATISNIAITAAGKTLTLNGVNLTASETLSITHPHENGGLLRIYAGSRNVYGLRTGADDLVVYPGRVNVVLSASRAGNLTVTNYSRWL